MLAVLDRPATALFAHQLTAEVGQQLQRTG
jgi:hypothetical protein